MREITSLDEIKAIELDVMKKIHSICEKHNITYYLCYGTLLGAVRHKGFIPWDDDIDIYMKRQDYQRFVTLMMNKADDFAEEGIEIVNYETPKYYGRIISKVIDTNTVLREPEYKTDDDIGVFVDVWPLDGTPNNKIYRAIYITYARLIKKLLLAASMNYSKDYSLVKRIAIRAASVFNPRKLLLHMDRIAQRYTPEDSDFFASYNDLTNIYAASNFEKKILMQFEETSFWGPEDYDSLLTADFGDYMKLPPESERIPHHVVNVWHR